MAGPLDPDKGTHVTIVGRKGTGKSVLARRLFDSYPYDRVVLDVTGDIRRDFAEEGVPYVKLTAPLPVRLPRGENGQPVTAVFVPDMGDPAALDDLDRALGLALARGRTLVWIDEVGVVTTANKTGPNMRRALHHGRHKQLTMLNCGPRPVDIDPLVLAQADETFVFDLPNPRDRERVANSIGWPPKSFDKAVRDLGEHEFLWWSTREKELRHMPALPPRRARHFDLPEGSSVTRSLNE